MMRTRGIAVRAAMVVFVLLSVLSGMIGISTLFVTDDPFPRDAGILIATFAAGMAVLGIAITLTGFRRGERWAWLALWYYPVFFVIHVLALGVVIPDAIFAALSAMALLLARPVQPDRALAQRGAGALADAR